MKIKIDIDDTHEATVVVTIHAKTWSEEVESVARHLKQLENNELASKESVQQKRIVGYDEDQSILLHPSEIDYVFAEKRKVYAMCRGRAFELKLKLYELEDTLEPMGFIRFSKSVIGNMDMIDRFELSFNGNLCVYFKSGSKEYVTRKYVHILKNQLIEGGGGTNE